MKMKNSDCIWKGKRKHNCQLCVADCENRTKEFDIESALEKNATESSQKDEIDEWLEKECGIFSGGCSSIESLKYSVAREVAEKLWNVGNNGKELLYVLNKGVEMGRRDSSGIQ